MPETELEPIEYRTLSVIVPVYNEAATVAEIIRRVRAAPVPLLVDVTVVDDASTDGTDKVLAAMADPVVRVVTHERNMGKGAAIRTALSHVHGDLVLIQDADLEYDPDDWPKLLEPILKRKAAVVYGSRFTGERKNMLLLHWVGQPLPVPRHQRAVLVDPVGHGDVLQAVRPARPRRNGARLRPV